MSGRITAEDRNSSLAPQFEATRYGNANCRRDRDLSRAPHRPRRIRRRIVPGRSPVKSPVPIVEVHLEPLTRKGLLDDDVLCAVLIYIES